VHPDHRRSGVGTGMLHGVLPTLREQGRSVVEGWNIPADGIGERWAAGLGFTRTNATVAQQLLLAQTDPARWAVAVPAGYRLLRWVGSAPEQHVESFACAQNAMHDSPRGQVGLKVPLWTAQRVRADEEWARTNGTRRLVVAALHEASNEVVGFTEVELRAGRTDLAAINNTAVRSEHRGHGLGRVVKADQARWLRADYPGFTRVMTATAVDNHAMIKVNEQIGYTMAHARVVLSADLESLAARLA
jgi:GNAT superfamily N-acetyltransferase